MFSSITTAPAKQSVSETIPILSNRLATATLLEDRRAAILGLRSFAKQYPASVASTALRSLISSLSRDGEDVDTVKVVLETLLMLFTPDPSSPEASEEIALWVADEFTQRHENISMLLGFLAPDRTDFYSRLYSLQLLAAILEARTERTEECIISTNEGIPRIVAALEDPREAIRDEAVGLLTDLTPTSTVIQNLVTLEKGFTPIFAIITREGGLAGGARVVEDCLVLLGNLLRMNPQNQTMFRDMGFVSEVARLLREAYAASEEGQPIAEWVEVQRNRNVFALLAVLRLFLVPGAAGTPLNQEAFLGDLGAPSGRGRGGKSVGSVLDSTLQIGFSRVADMPIRAEALMACADMIRGNAKLQERFAALQVTSPLDFPPEAGDARVNGAIPKVYVIDGLLDMVLGVSSLQAFDLRMAACACLKAYFYKHAEIRMHFLDHAVRTHKMRADDLTNALSILLQPGLESVVDPYRIWFAAVLILHLLHENPETKALAMSITEGDEENGEEVVTSIQTIAAHLLSSVSKNLDPRISIAYLMLLLCWLFEDLDAVNDFLGEATNLQGLIQAAIENPNGDVVVQGLSAMLAGVVYEFSTKDSPVPRATVREMIMSRMGRDRYVDKMSRLRSHPLMREFEVLPQKLEDNGIDLKPPEVFFDETFVEFFKDNYSRILRAIDRDPDAETSVIINGVQKGVSRQLVDDLRAELSEKSQALQDAESKLSSLTEQLAQEQKSHQHAVQNAQDELARAADAANALRAQLAARDAQLQSASDQTATLTRQLAALQQEYQRAQAEIVRLKAAADAQQRAHAAELKSVTENLQRSHDKQLAQLKTEHKSREDELTREMAQLKIEHKSRQEELTRAMEAVKKAVEQESERAKRRWEAESADLRATISRLEVEVMKVGKERQRGDERIKELEQAVQDAESRFDDAEKKLKKKTEEVKRLEGVEARLKELEAKLKEADEERGRLEAEVERRKKEKEEKEKEKKEVQGELDDLLMVFGDLEEKVTKYKVSLAGLRPQIHCTSADGYDRNGSRLLAKRYLTGRRKERKKRMRMRIKTTKKAVTRRNEQRGTYS